MSPSQQKLDWMTSPLPAWDLAKLHQAPKTYDAPGFSSALLRPLFYEGLPYHGKPTRHFAWLGLPHEAATRQVPGVILVHGGCATAFAEWARLWLQRGYAVIAPDICGQTPVQGVEDKFCDSWPLHEWSGPPAWGGSFKTLDEPVEEQWPYHAVSALILAQSLLAAQPGVAADRIGLTGISWGGTLACMMAGIDARLRCVAPVYGCGYDSRKFTFFAADQEPENKARWLELYNPANFLPNATMPMLWTTGTNDHGGALDHQLYSVKLATGPSTLCVKLRMVHGHGGVAERPGEIWQFFESSLNGGKPLLRILEQGREAQEAWLKYQAVTEVARAELLYTLDSGPFPECLWHTRPARLDARASRVTGTPPEGTRAYFFNVEDYRGFIVSSEHVELAHA